LTPVGKILSFLMIVALLGLGVWLMVRDGDQAAPPARQEAQAPSGSDVAQAPDGAGGGQAAGAQRTGARIELEGVIPAKTAVPQLAPPQPFPVGEDKIIEVELSEYPGYAGLIVANGGLEPNDKSFFARNYGFKVRLTLSEEESWDKLNSGKLAASATTVDVLAVFGRQFNVVVPAQIAFSRGADGIVVRSNINRINQLKGQILTASQFTEAEFFIRYLAQEAGIGVNVLADADDRPDPERINLLFCEDAFVAGDTFASALAAGDTRLAGCVTWAPKTTEVAEGS